ncbi:MAG: class I SAM-dependent methyltransferase [Myxococcales bacterium]|nr:class I SAM-dependent methyltransferase [Myxococcales bacterium]
MSDLPDPSAVRVALWRALHVEADPPPHVLDDTLGLALAAPSDDFRQCRDMDLRATMRARASIVARARFTEDLVAERAAHGVRQYVLLGAGLDTFAQRNPALASTLRVFEVDAPASQAWKQRRLIELGLPPPEWLRFVPVDFEVTSAWESLVAAGFDRTVPAIVAALGVTMYLTEEAVVAMFRPLAGLAPGSTVVLTFAPPLELLEPEEWPARKATEAGARAGGTPWRSTFTPQQLTALVQTAGFRAVTHVSARALTERYFEGRADGLRPSSGEEILLVAP